MRVLDGLQPEKVFYYFEEISKIPRGSGNTKAISDYCVQFAKDRGLFVVQDEVNNVIIKKNATNGKEESPTVILQGHLDMVTEKTNDLEHDFMKDGLKLMVEGDYVTADRTTLGADNGIAVAYALAILDSKDIPHPALEVLFTVDEEVGMDGAMFIDMSQFEGKYLLNLDCDMEDTLMAGCAGGVRINGEFGIHRTNISSKSYTITVSGLKGGHSGSEIDKERGNANIILGRVLSELFDENDRVCITDFAGGNKDNAITREATANIVFANKNTESMIFMDEADFNIEDAINELNKILKNEYLASDEGVFISITNNGYVEDENVWSHESQACILEFLYATPNGPINMCYGMNGLVETSLNLGITTTEEDCFRTVTTIRSVVASRKEWLKNRIVRLIELCNGEATILSDYPEWEFKRDSYLQKLLTGIYKKEFDRDLKVDVIHAGLECGYLVKKKPELDIVSFGPVMYDIHTTEERLSISSTELTYKFLLKILEEI